MINLQFILHSLYKQKYDFVSYCFLHDTKDWATAESSLNTESWSLKLEWEEASSSIPVLVIFQEIQTRLKIIQVRSNTICMEKTLAIMTADKIKWNFKLYSFYTHKCLRKHKKRYRFSLPPTLHICLERLEVQSVLARIQTSISQDMTRSSNQHAVRKCL
jgi:hypothetical protein